MQISYDKETDALYIQLLEGDFQCRAVRVTDDIALDFAAGERPAGIEALASPRPEHPFPVVCKEVSVWQEPVRAGQPLAFTPHKLRLDGRVRKVTFQHRTENKSRFTVECDQAPIKCPIEVRCQAEPILGIEAVLREFAPRQNVAGDQQVLNRIPCDATLGVVRGEHHFPEEALHRPHFYGRRSLG